MRLPDLRDEARRPLRDPSVSDERLHRYANEALRLAASRVFMPDLEAAAVVVVPAGAAVVALPGDFQRQVFAATGADGRRLVVVREAMEMAQLDSAHFSAGAVRFVAQGRGGLRVWPVSAAEEHIILGYFRLPHTLEQTAGKVAFDAATSSLTADGPLFEQFHFGDVFTVFGSATNDGEYTVVAAAGASCQVAEPLTDEAAVAVNIAATAIEAVPEHLHRDVVLPGLLYRAFEGGEDAFEGKKNSQYYRVLFDEGLRMLKRDVVGSGYRPPVDPSSTAGRGTLA